MLQKAAVHRYYSTKVCERSKLQLCLSDLLVNIFSQHWKLYRSDGQVLPEFLRCSGKFQQ